MRKYDPLLPHKTKAGINWVQDTYFVPMKICVGQHILKQSNLSGWYGESNLRRLEQLVGDRMPHAHDAFKNAYTGNNPKYKGPHIFGFVLSRRAANCLPEVNDELVRFREPIFQATWDAVAGKEKLTPEIIMELQQSRIKLEHGGKGGVYVRWNPEMPQIVYVGSTDDIAERSHTNQPLYLWDFFAVSDIKLAGNIESHTHDFLRDIGFSMHKNSRGIFKVHSGNARDLSVQFLQQHYGRIFRSYGGCKVD
jgi:hypothetical protein